MLFHRRSFCRPVPLSRALLWAAGWVLMVNLLLGPAVFVLNSDWLHLTSVAGWPSVARRTVVPLAFLLSLGLTLLSLIWAARRFGHATLAPAGVEVVTPSSDAYGPSPACTRERCHSRGRRQLIPFEHLGWRERRHGVEVWDRRHNPLLRAFASSVVPARDEEELALILSLIRLHEDMIFALEHRDLRALTSS